MRFENALLIAVSVLIMAVVTVSFVFIFTSFGKEVKSSFIIEDKKNGIKKVITKSEECYSRAVAFMSVLKEFTGFGGKHGGELNCTYFCSNITIDEFRKELVEIKAGLQTKGEEIHLNVITAPETLYDYEQGGKVYQLYAPRVNTLKKLFGGVSVKMRMVEDMRCTDLKGG